MYTDFFLVMAIERMAVSTGVISCDILLLCVIIGRRSPSDHHLQPNSPKLIRSV
jgi:hypothetical protein